MSQEPVFLEHVTATPNLRRRFLQFHPQQEGVFRDMKDSVPALGKDDDFVAVLLEQLAAPALPAHRFIPHRRLLRPPAVRGGQRKHRQGEEDVHLDGTFRLLRGMLQVPGLLALFDTAVLDEAAVVIGVKDSLNGLSTASLVSNTTFPPGP
jgi:hypothetical protein